MSNQSPVLMREGDDEDLRLLLIGKAGSGKSATGNTIFNETVFNSKISPSPVTKTSQPHTGAVNNRSVTVIDTPDFIFSTHTDFDSDSELKRALELCSAGAHVILLILPLSTFTEQEKHVVSQFEQKFGVDALRFTLVLFTHAEKPHSKKLEALIRKNNELSDFIDRCGGGFCGMNNKAPENRRQVTELMEKIDRLILKNRNSCYSLEMMQETERRREQRERRAEEERRERVKIDTETRVRREFEEQEERRTEEKREREKAELLYNQEKARKRMKQKILFSLLLFVLMFIVVGVLLFFYI